MVEQRSKFRFVLSSADEAPITTPILLVGSIIKNIIAAGTLGYNAIEIHMRENTVLEYDAIQMTSEVYNVRTAAIVTGRLAIQEKVTLTDSSKRMQRLPWPE